MPQIFCWKCVECFDGSGISSVPEPVAPLLCTVCGSVMVRDYKQEAMGFLRSSCRAVEQ